MKQSVAICIAAYLLAGCAEPTSTQLQPNEPRYITIQSKPVATLTLSSFAPCVTRVEWDGGGIASVEHRIELEGGVSLAVIVAPDKPPRSSTVQWNPNDFYGGTGRTPTGRIAAIARDRKNNIVASTDFESVNFDCGGP
jgi:hypothetical protein